jgi:glucokinase
MPEDLVLACDVGGTKTRVALFEPTGRRLELVRTETYASRQHRSLEEVIDRFLGTPSPRLVAAGLGVAGPVIEGRVRTTNLPWIVDAEHVAQRFRVGAIALVNDVVAHARAVEYLGPGDLVELQRGASSSTGTIAVIAAGTGLGFAALVREGSSVAALASEGGHAAFAAQCADEIELVRYLRARFEHVSAERVLSGPGLENIYLFLRDTGRGDEPAWLAEELQRGDHPAVISAAALEGRSALCREALRLFVRIYGAEAGNWALRTLATGGVYLAGGIAPKLFATERARGEPSEWIALFLRRFLEAGRLRSLLENIPVSVITSERAALLGVAHCALAISAA